jgi:hypothetical protein
MLDRARRTLGFPLLLGAFAVAPAAFAQTPAPPPAAPTAAAPATPAAPAAPAAKPCAAPEYHQFDFWIGNWEVKNPEGEFEGTNRIDVIEGGCAIQEHWVGAKGGTGTSFNTYDQGAHKWHQTWIDNHGGILILNGEFAGGKMTLSGEMASRVAPGKTVLHRIAWTPLDANHVRQFWEVSRDGGKTWKTNFDGTYSRK